VSACILFLLLFWPPQSDEATLRLKTDVSHVKVQLDGKEVGETPLTLRPVSPGPHTVSLSKTGYEDHVEEVRVEAGATAKVFVVMRPVATPLPPLPATFRVVHQHRLGACSGLLTVSADALDYKSDDGKDVFHIPLRDVQSVSRSLGPIPSMENPDTGPGELQPVRVELPGRSYGFLTYEADPKKLPSPADINSVIVHPNRLLFDLVYRLWTESRNMSKKQLRPDSTATMLAA
jgi:hypothetical protein